MLLWNSQQWMVEVGKKALSTAGERSNQNLDTYTIKVKPTGVGQGERKH